MRYVRREAPAAAARLVRRRVSGHRYEVDSHSPSRSLLLLSNGDGAVNRELRVASLDAPSEWRPLLMLNGGAATTTGAAAAANADANAAANADADADADASASDTHGVADADAVAAGEAAPPVLVHDAGRSLESLLVFDGHIAVTGREGGAPQVWSGAARTLLSTRASSSE